MTQGLELEYLNVAGIKPWLTQEPGTNTVVDKRAYKLSFKPDLAETVGHRNAKLDSEGVPTNIHKHIPLGVSFKTDDGQILFSKLKPLGGCPWCLDPVPHSNIRSKGGAPTPHCIYSKYCRCCGIKFKDLINNKYGEKHNCTGSGADMAFYDPPKRPDPSVAPPAKEKPRDISSRIRLSDEGLERLAKKRRIQDAAIAAQRLVADQIKGDRMAKQEAHHARMAKQQADKLARNAAKRSAPGGEDDSAI